MKQRKKEYIIKKTLYQLKKYKEYNDYHKLDEITLQFYFKGDLGKISKDTISYIDKTLGLNLQIFLEDYLLDIKEHSFLSQQEEKILGNKNPIEYLKNIRIINLKQMY